jgi:ferredoxin
MDEMRLEDRFSAAFGVWPEARSHLDLMVDEQEMELILAIQGREVTVGEAADLMAISHDRAAVLLERCHVRCIVDRIVAAGATTYTPGSFYSHLDYFAKFERWDEIPAEDRRAIDRRFLNEFIARHRANIEQKMQGREAVNMLPNDTVLLLREVEEMIGTAAHIVVQPCDCRRLGQNCERPVDTCIWLDDSALEALDRGHGRRLTKEEALDLVRWADRKGLMHTADSEWRTRGLHAICNCCACDCYPFRAAQELGSKGVWPRSRYIAAYDQEACNLCGACVKRCHFDAFYHDESAVEVDGKMRRGVQFEPERCWGCGLCTPTCPAGAIEMEPWP